MSRKPPSIRLQMSDREMNRLFVSNSLKELIGNFAKIKKFLSENDKKIIGTLIGLAAVVGVKLVILEIRFMYLEKLFSKLPVIIQKDLEVLTSLGIDSVKILSKEISLYNSEKVIRRRMNRVSDNSKAKAFLRHDKVDDFLHRKFLEKN